MKNLYLPNMLTVLLVCLSFAAAQENSPAPTTPCRIIVSCDNANLTRTEEKRERIPLTDEIITASIDRSIAGGCDLFMLETVTYVPCWKSSIYPIEEHVAWFRKNFNGRINNYAKYMLEGGDMIKVMTGHCRSKGIAPFVSFRMNDWHGMFCLEVPKTVRVPDHVSFKVDRFRKEHPEYWITKPEERNPIPPEAFKARNFFRYLRMNKLDGRLREEHLMNWKRGEVRNRLFSLIQEVCENYDIDGIQLDFMRHNRYYFRAGETSHDERVNIFTGFIQRVRRMLDQTARHNKKRLLCVRIPAWLAACKERGFDIKSLAGAGVDMFNLSNNYYSVQQSDLRKMKQRAPDAAFYLEMTYCLAVGHLRHGRRFTQPEHFRTTADLVYHQGGAGLSLFNIQWYRPYARKDAPWGAIRTIKDPKKLAQGSRQYFLAKGWNSHLKVLKGDLPEHIKEIITGPMAPGRTRKLAMEMSLPQDIRDRKSVLRFQSEEPFTDQVIQVRLNGLKLAARKNTAPVFDSPYPAMIPDKDTWRAWHVPVSALKNGRNVIEIVHRKGEPFNSVYVEIAVR
mgnify:CR=1 FL=1